MRTRDKIKNWAIIFLLIYGTISTISDIIHIKDLHKQEIKYDLLVEYCNLNMWRSSDTQDFILSQIEETAEIKIK